MNIVFVGLEFKAYYFKFELKTADISIAVGAHYWSFDPRTAIHLSGQRT